MKAVQLTWRLLCIGVSAATLAISAANAADLSPGYQTPMAPVPVYRAFYTWTGFYLGINGGGGWGRSQWDGINPFDVSGGFIGGTVGYNWQIGHVVLGAEGDIDWSGIDGTTTAIIGWPPYAAASATPGTGSCPTSPADWRWETSTRRYRACPAAASPTRGGRSERASRSELSAMSA